MRIIETEAKAIYSAGLDRVRTIPEPEGQKYHIGQRVHIADDLGSSMAHFPAGVGATVEYTYAHAYGGNNITSYSLIVDGVGPVAWYDEWQLTPELT